MLFRFEFLFHFSKAFAFCKYCRTAPWCRSPYFSLKFANNVKRIYFCSFCFKSNYLKEKDMLPKKIYHILESSWSWKKERLLYSKVLLKIRSRPHCNFFGEEEFRRAVFHCWRTDWNGASSWQCSTRSSTALIG